MFDLWHDFNTTSVHEADLYNHKTWLQISFIKQP